MLIKKMKGFARYAFFEDYTVINTLSELIVMPEIINAKKTWRLTNDKGIRQSIYDHDFKILFGKLHSIDDPMSLEEAREFLKKYGVKTEKVEGGVALKTTRPLKTDGERKRYQQALDVIWEQMNKL